MRREGGRPNRRADVEAITQADIAWRIGASAERPVDPDAPGETPWVGGEEAARAPAGASPAAAADRPPSIGEAARRRISRRGPMPLHAHPVVAGPTRRRILWRDASALLFGVLLIGVVIQAVGMAGRPSASDPASLVDGDPTQLAAGSTGTPADTARVTVGPAIDASLLPGLEATPTAGATAVPTSAPTDSPGHSPGPTPRRTPIPTVPPTPAPTAPPTASPTDPPPTVGPTIAPTPTPTPAPLVSFECAVPTLSWEMSCTDSSLYGATYLWDFGDGATSTEQSPSHVYAPVPQTYTVTLTVTNASGSASSTQNVTVPG